MCVLFVFVKAKPVSKGSVESHVVGFVTAVLNIFTALNTACCLRLALPWKRSETATAWLYCTRLNVRQRNCLAPKVHAEYLMQS